MYHCQQAVEKAIKAYLIYRDVVFEKTHNLVVLLFACTPFEPRFKQWKEVAETLSPYAAEFRYPREIMEPEKSEVEQALVSAKSFVDFIIQLLPDEVGL